MTTCTRIDLRPAAELSRLNEPAPSRRREILEKARKLKGLTLKEGDR